MSFMSRLKARVKAVPAATDLYRLLKNVRRSATGYSTRRDLRARLRPAQLPGYVAGVNRFVGYYDHSPFKEGDEDLLLIHSVRSPAYRRPDPNSVCSIQLINHRTGEVAAELGQTFSWNWQQGARALWMNPETVVYNIYDEAQESYRARIVPISGGKSTLAPIPVQEVDSQGRIYSLSYEALSAIRPDYGYRNHKRSSSAMLTNAIKQFDPSVGELRTLVAVSELVEEATARHPCRIEKAKFNHVMASPDGEKILYLFRYFARGKRITDLYCSPTSPGKAILLVPDSGASHACWWDDDRVLVTMAGAKGFGYYLVSCSSAESQLIWLHKDGHPLRFNDRFFLTDTYPNSRGVRELLMFSLRQSNPEVLLSCPEPTLFHGETRCDLHPSLSPSGRWIQVDCAIGVTRSIAVLENPHARPV